MYKREEGGFREYTIDSDGVYVCMYLRVGVRAI